MNVTAYDVYMEQQKIANVYRNNPLLPDQWQLDAMERYAELKANGGYIWERYYANINQFCHLSKTANRALNANFSKFDYEVNGYGFIKISGYQYRTRL